VLDFLDQPGEVRPGDRVVSSGDGGLFPPELLIGQVVVSPDGRMRALPAADYRRLEFVRVIRRQPPSVVEGPGGLIGPLTAVGAAAPSAAEATP
jgi:rod shape-determining protein MreC